MWKRYIIKIDNDELVIDAKKEEGNIYSIKMRDKIFEVDMIDVGIPPLYSLILNGCSYEVNIDSSDENYEVSIGEETFDIIIVDEKTQKLRALRSLKPKKGIETIKSTMPGKVLNILVKKGEQVVYGQPLIIIEAMKMENEIRSPKDGIISSIDAETGSNVEIGAALMIIA